MQKYANQEGFVTLDRFIALISKTNWRELLPDEMQKNLNGLAVHSPQPAPSVPPRKPSSPERQREIDSCYGKPAALDPNSRAATFQALRSNDGSLPVRMMKPTSPETKEAMANRAPVQQPISPQNIRTGVVFKKPPRSQLNPHGLRKPTGPKGKTYNTMIGEASNVHQIQDEVNSIEDFTAIAKNVFNTIDADKNGKLDTGELSLALQHVWAEIGQTSLLSTPARCTQEATKMMEQLGDEKGEIEFPTFLRIVTKEPWNNLLPPQARARANFYVMKLVKQPKPTALDRCLQKLKQLFDDVDSDADGLLNYDQFEVCWETQLYVCMW